MSVLARHARLPAAALAALALTACGPREPGVPVHAFQGRTMGTTYIVKVAGTTLDEAALRETERVIAGELELVNARMSHYLSDSELSRFNRYRETKPFIFSAETFEVLEEAQRVSALTDGAFDVTVAPLVNAWGFGPEGELGPPPSADDIAALRDRIGYRKLELAPDTKSAGKLEPSLVIDLSAIAKGYGVDRVAEALLSRGLTRFMVEVGGEVRTSGVNPSGEPWRIAIERPSEGARQIETVIPLSGQSLATSGDYRNFYEVQGKRLSHTIDPRTGNPVQHRLASVSVVTDRCMRSDALATALLVLGPEAGLALAREHDLAALFLVRTEDGFREHSTPAFDALRPSPVAAGAAKSR